MAKKKYRVGLRNVYYALKTDEGYATPKSAPYARSLTLDYEGDQSKYYADDHAIAVLGTNNGFTGTLTLTVGQNDFLCDVFGYEQDDNGAIIQLADVNPKEFALLYEVQGDEGATRFVLYDCQLTPPSKEHNTQEDTTEPDEESFELTAIPAEIEYANEKRSIVGTFVDNDDKGATAYAGWFSKVYTPVKAAA